MKPIGIVLGTICALIVVAMIFAASGLYNVSARVPHLAPVALLLEEVRERSIAHHSKNIDLPAAEEPEVVMTGAIHFDSTCSECHGAPGKPPEEFAQGLYPKPPSLADEAKEMNREELFWVIDNGLKMTGMPAFGVSHERDEIIAMTAFIEKLAEFDDEGYLEFVKQAKAQAGGEDHHHTGPEPDMHPDEGHGHAGDADDHHHD